MATLNLQPNPVVLAIQAGIFLVNLVIIKKTIVEPFVATQDKRKQLTVGGKESADQLRRQNEGARANIHKSMHDALSNARAIRDDIKSRAQKSCAEIYSDAEKEAKAIVAAARSEIEAELARERAKVPQIVSTLSQAFYQQALS